MDLNWRAACRGRSHKEFTAKLGVVVEEADEAEGCLDTIWNSGMSTTETARRLRAESKELRAIFNKAERTARANEEAAAFPPSSRLRRRRVRPQRLGLDRFRLLPLQQLVHRRHP